MNKRNLLFLLTISVTLWGMEEKPKNSSGAFGILSKLFKKLGSKKTEPQSLTKKEKSDIEQARKENAAQILWKKTNNRLQSSTLAPDEAALLRRSKTSSFVLKLSKQ